MMATKQRLIQTTIYVPSLMPKTPSLAASRLKSDPLPKTMEVYPKGEFELYSMSAHLWCGAYYQKEAGETRKRLQLQTRIFAILMDLLMPVATISSIASTPPSLTKDGEFDYRDCLRSYSYPFGDPFPFAFGDRKYCPLLYPPTDRRSNDNKKEKEK